MVGGLVKYSTTLLGKRQATRQQSKKKRRQVCDDKVDVVAPSLRSVHGWFRGKSFFLCGDKDRCSYLCKIPGSWLEKSLIVDLVRKADEKPNETLLLSTSYNHNLRHQEDQPQFAFPQTQQLVHQDSYDDVCGGLAAWASLGSTIYFFGGHTKRELYSRDIHYIETDVVSPQSHKYLKKGGLMVTERYIPKVVGLDGKMYIFGGEGDYGDKEVLWVEIFEPQPNTLLGHCRALPSPQPHARFVDAVVAVENERKIVVSCDYKVYEYDVDRNSWVNIILPPLIRLRSPLCRPVAVGSILYWLNESLVAYDLEKKQIFMGPIEDILLQHILETPDRPFEPKDFQVSLLHLGDEFFYVVWIGLDAREILHFTMIRVVRLNSVFGPNYNLQVSVLSCQTVVSQIPLELKDQLLMI